MAITSIRGVIKRGIGAAPRDPRLEARADGDDRASRGLLLRVRTRQLPVTLGADVYDVERRLVALDAGGLAVRTAKIHGTDTHSKIFNAWSAVRLVTDTPGAGRSDSTGRGQRETQSRRLTPGGPDPLAFDGSTDATDAPARAVCLDSVGEASTNAKRGPTAFVRTGPGRGVAGRPCRFDAGHATISAGTAPNRVSTNSTTTAQNTKRSEPSIGRRSGRTRESTPPRLRRAGTPTPGPTPVDADRAKSEANYLLRDE